MPAELLAHVLSWLQATEAFSALQSCAVLRAAVTTAARTSQLAKRCRPHEDAIERYLAHYKRAGDRLSLFVRLALPHPGPWRAMVAVRFEQWGSNKVDGWRLDFLDGGVGVVCLDEDTDEAYIPYGNLAEMYSMWYKLRI